MAKAKKESSTKKDSSVKKYEITTDTGSVIYRENIGDYKKVYEAKGFKVKEV